MHKKTNVQSYLAIAAGLNAFRNSLRVLHNALTVQVSDTTGDAMKRYSTLTK